MSVARFHRLLRLAWMTGIVVVIVGSLPPDDSLPIRAGTVP